MATVLNMVTSNQPLVDGLNALAEGASYVKEGYHKTLIVLVSPDMQCVFIRANVDEIDTVGFLEIAKHLFLTHAREVCDA